MDGDGISDLIVNAMRYPSSPTGSPGVLSGAHGTLQGRIDEMRFNVGWVGELSGGGSDEFAYGRQGCNSSKGRAWIWAGGQGSVVRHCAAAPDGSGEPARLTELGPISVGCGDLSLGLTVAPSGEPARVFHGAAAAPVPFGGGTLRVALGPGPFRRPAILTTDPQGQARLPTDRNAPPASHPQSTLVPGSTWTLQAWYRDPSIPPGTNLSDALTIPFVPWQPVGVVDGRGEEADPRGLPARRSG